jgi:hypothetical protein
LDYYADIVSYVEGLCGTVELTEVYAQVDNVVLKQLPIGFLLGSWGFTYSRLRSRYRVQMAWYKLESRLILFANIDCVILQPEKHRLMVDSLSPLQGKCIV